MIHPLRRAMLFALMIGAVPASAQPVPPAPPAKPAKPAAPAKLATPSKSSTGSTAVKPTVTPAPHTAVHSAPLVQPKPGAPAHRPPTKSAPHAAPVTVPAPAPVPAPEPEKPAEPTKGSNTGNPLPRFVTLRSDEVNLRAGPGTRYPIEWVYKRRDLPVMIEREFEVWRLIRDPDGIKGWVHQATLAPRRTAVVIGTEQTLRHDPRDDASPVARLKAGVILRLRSCEATSDWCQSQVQDYRGWIKRTEIWGTFPGEAIQ